MARQITTLQIEAELYNKIANLRGFVSEELRFNERSLGLAPMLGLLVDHWQAHPPDREWLEQQAQLYPKRGRPPKQIVGTLVKSPLGKKATLGHELFSREAAKGSTYRLVYCKNCTMQFSTWDSQTPPARCPGDGITVSIYDRKRWTKNELLADGFEAHEVDWADP